MNVNVILEYFDKLNDENAMFVEFKHTKQLLIDNNDIIRAMGDLIEIKTDVGTYVTDCENVVGLKIAKRLDIMRKTILEGIVEEIGDA